MENKIEITNEELYVRLGKLKYRALEPSVKKNVKARYNILGDDDPEFDEKICKYIQDITPPIMDPMDEIIPRCEWDLDILESSSSENLYHEHHQIFRDHVLNNHKKEHDVLCLFQCSASKPYYSNRKWSVYWRNYGDYVDFAFSSVAGVIPKGMDNMYPIRYTNMGTAVAGDIKYDAGMVKANNLLDFQRKFKYQKVILYIPNPESSWMYKKIYDENVDNCQDWMVFVVTDDICKADMDEIFSGDLGLTISRMWNSLRCKWRLEDEILSGLKDPQKTEFMKIIEIIRHDRITKSMKSRAKKDAARKKKLEENKIIN